MEDKHLFFDLDRTLWDFEKNSQKALTFLHTETLLSEHIPNFHDFFHTYKKVNSELWKLYGKGKIDKDFLRTERFRATLAKFKIHNDELSLQLSDGYVKHSPFQTALFPNSIETLNYLQKEGYQMHIITNGFKEVQFIKLENSGLINFFDVIVCSEDVGMNKPSPEIFQHALKKAKASPSKSVMIGDDYEVDILGGLNYGMHAIHFDPQHQFKNTSSEHRIRNIDELPALLPWVFKNSI